MTAVMVVVKMTMLGLPATATLLTKTSMNSSLLGFILSLRPPAAFENHPSACP